MTRRRRSHDEFLDATLPALDLVYNLARRLVDPDDVDDVVQETFTRAFDAWMKGRPPKKVEPWPVTICLNTSRSHAKESTEEGGWRMSECVSSDEDLEEAQRDAG